MATTITPASGSPEVLGPATFNTLTLCSVMNLRKSSTFFAVDCALDMWRQGFWSATARSLVASEPPVRMGEMLNITVASESRAFHSVRWMYSALGVSCRIYLALITPSSASRPFGHQPPCGILLAMAQSSAARSTPVWPPEMIFEMCTGR